MTVKKQTSPAETDKFPQDSLAELLRQLGFTPRQEDIYHQAFLHSSYVNESPALKTLDHNERLEFLGDAVISLIVCDYLYRRYPQFPEGQLTKIKSLVVSRPILARRARELNLGDYLLLGHGEKITGGKDRDSLLSNAFESLVGAIYLDQGFVPAGEFILRQLQEVISQSLQMEAQNDYKTMLQEYSQKLFKTPPQYKVLKEKGPDHAKTYHVEVKLPNDIKGLGEGPSKKEAEQMAAKAAYQLIKD